MSKNQGKSYNQAMSEWAEKQSSFLRKGRGGILRPSYSVSGWARVWGYTWRVLLVVILTSGIYVAILHKHGASGEFSKMMKEEARVMLGAREVKTAFAWQIGGILSATHLEAAGGPDSFFKSLTADGVQLDVPVPRVFRTDWDVESAKIGSLVMELRSGASGEVSAPDEPKKDDNSGVRTGAVRHTPPVMTAGWGIRPDLRRMKVHTWDFAEANLSWGVTAPGRGALTDAVTRAVLTGENSWDITVSKGVLRLGWLDNLVVSSAHLSVAPGLITVKDCLLETDPQQLMLRGGASREVPVNSPPSMQLSGTVATGELPILDLKVKVNAMPLHYFIPRDAAHEPFWRMFDATVSGDSVITGSLNRDTQVGLSDRANISSGLVPGVEIDSRFNVLSGTITNVPLLAALANASGSDGLKTLRINSGRLRFRYGGSSTSGARAGGLGVELKELELQSDVCRVSAQMTYERETVPGSAVGSVSLQSTISIGLTKDVAGRIPPSVLAQLGVAEHEGLVWINTGRLGGNGAKLTTELADSITEMMQRLKATP